MISIAELTDWLGSPDEPGVTAMLEALEESAVELVQDETGRHFGADATQTEYIVGDGTVALRLNENATAITSVGQRCQVGDAFDAIAEGDSDGFEIRAPRADAGRATLLRKNAIGWLDGFEYRVIYDFGYATNAEPKRIRQAVKDLVALKYHSRGREGLRSFNSGGVQFAQFTSITSLDVYLIPGLSQVLARWRIQRMMLR